MKKLYTLLALVLTLITFAQAPQGFNYQATVRNSAGALIVNQNVNFKFNIMLNSVTSLPVFSETHLAPTDDLGQVNLVIGQGTATVGTFSSINWGSGNYFLGIELNTGSGYVAMGTTQLLSVPYALYANSSGNAQAATPNLASVLAVNNGANNLQIKNLSNPTDAQDAVTKSYLDNILNNNNSIPSGINNGDMLYWNNNNWSLVNHGANGQILTFCNGVPTWTTNGICPPQVGDNYQGGIIIYINQPGDIGYVHGQTHGIIASIIDQTINSTSSYYPGETGCMWQPGTYDAQAQTSHFNVTNSRGIAVGTGSQNTNMILAVSQQTGMPFPAATLATQYTAGGYNDWILPSKDELRLLYQHRNTIGGFANGWYWSSTEMNDAYAEALDFSTGNFSGGYKGPGATPYKVRAVRYF
jgi:hypothetical protein